MVMLNSSLNKLSTPHRNGTHSFVAFHIIIWLRLRYGASVRREWMVTEFASGV